MCRLTDSKAKPKSAAGALVELCKCRQWTLATRQFGTLEPRAIDEDERLHKRRAEDRHLTRVSNAVAIGGHGS